MGTRSTTKIKDENGKVLVTLYRQYDGYPTGLGQELAAFLNGKKLVNGFGDSNSTTEANGMGCLAALLIGHLKKGRIGDVYVTTPDDLQEYNYTVYVEDGEFRIKVESEYYGFLFDGTAREFDGEVVEKNRRRAEAYV